MTMSDIVRATYIPSTGMWMIDDLEYADIYDGLVPGEQPWEVAAEIGGAVITVSYSERLGDNGRDRYAWSIQLADGRRFENDDLQSGCGGGNLVQGMASLLSFLSAFAESWHYSGSEGENADLFPEELAPWAIENSDEFSIAEEAMEKDHE
jgi:hypothetical protein